MKFRNPFKNNIPSHGWRNDATKLEKWIWSMIIFSIGVGFLIYSMTRSSEQKENDNKIMDCAMKFEGTDNIKKRASECD